MNKRHYEHTLPNIRGSLSNTYESSLSGKSGMFDIKGAVSIAEAALFRLCLFPYAAETGCCERTGAFTATIRLAASSLLLSPFRAVWRCVPDGCRPAE